MTELTSELITEREKAAIRLHVFGNIHDWRLLYAMAGGRVPDGAQSLQRYVSRWKNSNKTKNEIEAQRRELYAAKLAEREAWEKEKNEKDQKDDEEAGNEDSKKGKKSLVDYTDPEAQKTLLNRLIRDAKNPDDKLDALKIIVSTQRDDRQAAREGKQIRAYLPLICQKCPLYLKEKAKLKAEI